MSSGTDRGRRRDSRNPTGNTTTGPSASDSVGSLLAAIANLIADGLRILSFSDKRQWGPDEHEQVHALEDALDEARKDFQELSPLVNGQLQYEADRTRELLPCLALSGFRTPRPLFVFVAPRIPLAMTSLESWRRLPPSRRADQIGC